MFVSIMYVHCPSEMSEDTVPDEGSSDGPPYVKEGRRMICLSAVFAVSHIVLMLYGDTKIDIKVADRIRTLQASKAVSLICCDQMCLTVVQRCMDALDEREIIDCTKRPCPS